MLEVTLPWPPKELSPNARVHWAKLSGVKKNYRWACHVMALKAGMVGMKGPLNVHLHFVPPDRRPRDWDNMLASVKSGLDGVADAMGVNDKDWRISFDVGPGPGGFVRLTATGEGALRALKTMRNE